MPIFTSKGIFKLQVLKKDLLELSKKPFQNKESSDYSHKMVLNLIEIINQFEKHNEISYWKSDKNQKELEKLIDHLDESKGTFVPDVFNQESKELADILLKHAKGMNLNEDLDSSVATLLIPILGAGPQTVADKMTKALEWKSRFYDVFVKNEENSKRDADEKLAMGNEIGGALYDEAKKASKENVEDFKSKYEIAAKKYIDNLKTFPYVRLANASALVNALRPYHLDRSQVASSGSRGSLISRLLRYEMQINRELKQKGLPLVTTAYDHFVKLNSKEKHQNIQLKLEGLVGSFVKEAESYKTHYKGAVSLFKKVDADKKIEMERLQRALKLKLAETNPTEKNQLATGVASFEIFLELLDGAKQNERISASKNKSLGEFAKIVNAHAMKFFSLPWFEIDETNELSVGNQLKQYAEQFSLDNNNNKRMTLA